VNRRSNVTSARSRRRRSEAKSNKKEGQVNKNYDRLLHGPKPGTSSSARVRKGRAEEADTRVTKNRQPQACKLVREQSSDRCANGACRLARQAPEWTKLPQNRSTSLPQESRSSQVGIPTAQSVTKRKLTLDKISRTTPWKIRGFGLGQDAREPKRAQHHAHPKVSYYIRNYERIDCTSPVLWFTKKGDRAYVTGLRTPHAGLGRRIRRTSSRSFRGRPLGAR
jgi:hypothetical protein